MKPIAHVPASYVSTELGATTLWTAPRSPDRAPVSALRALVPSCIDAVERLLGRRFHRRIHVVVYATSDDSERALGRAVSPTFLMAPRHAEDHAVVILHAAALDPENGDLPRMRRLLCHELAHVAAAEKTGSLKRLGDGGCDMRVRPWVDEGFAVYVGAMASGQPEAVARVIEKCPESPMTPGELDASLNDLTSPKRAAAFAVATAMVYDAADRHGLCFVFAHLDEPARWLPADLSHRFTAAP